MIHSILDEGEYVCPRCTVFGLEKAEVQTLIERGFKMTDHNKEEEGLEVNSSAFKVLEKFQDEHHEKTRILHKIMVSSFRS